MKKKLIKRLSGLLIAVLTVGLLATGCSVESSSSDSEDVVTIKAATGGSPKPYVYVDEDGEPTGYDIEVLKEVFNRLDGYELEIEVADFSAVLSGLTSGNYQIGVNNFTYNEERAESYLFSYPYDKVNYVIVSRPDDVITSLEDAAGRSFEDAAGVAITTAIETWNEEYPDSQIDITYTEADTAIRLQHVEDGSIDFVIINEAMFNTYIDEYGYNLTATALSQEEQERIAKNLYAYFLLGKDQEELRDEIDEVLKEMQADGTLTELSEEFLGVDEAPEGDQFEETLN